MADYQSYLQKAEEYRKILERQLALFGEAHAPPHLFLQLQDSQRAIDLTNQAMRNEITEEEWKEQVQELTPNIGPVEQVLQINLQEYFSVPIARLNDDTRQMWQTTIRYAQYGFLARIMMSVAVFLAGLVLFCASSWQILFGNLTSEHLFGPGFSFIAGIGAMLAVIYSGPLKEIRKSVNDLGIASAAFIAYVHRVLEISHTFSYYYLKNKITFDEMTKSSKLINEAMTNTISTFRTEEAERDKAAQPSVVTQTS